MSDKTYLIRFKDPALGIRSVTAASAEIHGEYIALLNSKGKLAALFLTEVTPERAIMTATKVLLVNDDEVVGIALADDTEQQCKLLYLPTPCCDASSTPVAAGCAMLVKPAASSRSR